MAARDELDIPMPAMMPGYRAATHRRPAMDPATRRLAIFAGVIGGVLVLLVGVWSFGGHRHGGIPVIEADSRPLKVKPANPGGLQIEGANDSILSGEADGHASVAPGPEAPAVQALKAQQLAAQDQMANDRAVKAPPVKDAPPQDVAAKPADADSESIGQPATPGAPDAKAIHPRPLAAKTAGARSTAATQMTAQMGASADGGGGPMRMVPGVVPSVAAAALGTPKRTQLAQASAPITAEPLPAPAPSAPAPQPMQSQQAPADTQPAAAAPPAQMTPTAPPPAAAATAPPPKPAARPPAPATASAAPPVAAGGHTLVQLGALPSGEAALQEWTRLQKKYPDMFGGRTANVTRTEHDGKVFWRLRTDGFANNAQAAVFCQRIKAKGGNCAVATF